MELIDIRKNREQKCAEFLRVKDKIDKKIKAGPQKIKGFS